MFFCRLGVFLQQLNMTGSFDKIMCVGLGIRDVSMCDFHLYEWKISEAHLIHVWTGNSLVCSRNFY